MKSKYEKNLLKNNNSIINIIIGADLVPTESNYKEFISGDIDSLFGEQCVKILKNADLRIFNLETPLTNKYTPIEKVGPALVAPAETVVAMRKMNIDLFTLANNHCFDQGAEGLIETFNTLENNKINYVGAGVNYISAKKPYIKELKGKKIGVYACCEKEFSINSKNSPGANWFDPLTSLDDIIELKSKCDFLIVLYHGGKEEYRYPSPYLQKVCHKIVEKGADLVITQHSHCIGAEEDYLHGKIVYGQGNFIFDAENNEYWNSGLLVSIRISMLDNSYEVDYIPISKKDNFIRIANEEEKKEIFDSFYDRSELIKDEKNVETLYSDFALKCLNDYEIKLAGKFACNFMFRIINKITRYKFINCFYGKQDKLRLINCFECEAHNELIVHGLKSKL